MSVDGATSPSVSAAIDVPSTKAHLLTGEMKSESQVDGWSTTAFQGTNGGGVTQPVSESPRKSQRDDDDDSAEFGPYISTVLKSEEDIVDKCSNSVYACSYEIERPPSQNRYRAVNKKCPGERHNVEPRIFFN